MLIKRCSAAGVVLAVSATGAWACDFFHGEAGGEFGKHSNTLGDGGLTSPNAIAHTGRYNITLLSHLTLPQLGGGTGSSLWGWVDPVTNREYAIFGRSTGTSFVDVTDPYNPRIVGTLPRIANTSATSWREPKVIGNYVYIGVDGATAGIQVMDLTKLRNMGGTPGATLTADAIYGYAGSGSTSGLLTRAHTLAIETMGGYSNTPFLFVAGSNLQNGGIHAINVSNPLAPTFAGGFAADGYTHEMQVVNYQGPDVTHRGRQIAFAYNVDTLTVVDVTNKSAMTMLGRTVQPMRPGPAEARYVHQGWLTPDQKYVISNDELDERPSDGGTRPTRTHLWDVRDLDNPVYKGAFTHSGVNVDHNLYIVGNFVFQSNYTHGLRVFRIGNLEDSDPQAWLEPIAGFDTYPANDGNSFNGLWNNFPFFPSGNIALADINGGLMMVRLSETRQISPSGELRSSGLSLHEQLVAYNRAAYEAYRATLPEPAAAAGLAIAGLALARRRSGRRARPG
ncbi:MAG: choice-of-anchor B family protein [Phycisphaerae bacterium]|nr:choice-of-anchor B family protein [Phycisphaerae bacterium]MDW8261785.1 choice-of-anchor B family protein [Phycisphaerales bacterium]